MSQRLIPTLVAAALLAGCGVGGGQAAAPRVQNSLAQAQAASTAFGTQALQAFEAKPSRGLKKTAAPIGIDPILDPQPRVDLPESIMKIQNLAVLGLTEADTKETWNDRWMCSDAALSKIDAVKLAANGVNNVPAKVGLYAARGYGYLGQHPTHENRFKIQAVTLNYLRNNDAESSLAKGSPIFTMSADMLESTTGWDQGFRVGLSVLLTLKDNYKDKEVAKACKGILDKATNAASKEESYQEMVTGLRVLSKR